MFKKIFLEWKATIIIGLGILLLGLVLRLVNLDALPIFADEAIYVRWAQVMRAEATLRFLPLSDGKQPLFMWLVIPFLKIIRDPLFAGRVTSIFAGVGTLVGIFIGSFLFELFFQRDFLKSLKAGAGGIAGRFGSIAAKLLIGAAMVYFSAAQMMANR